MRLTRGRLSVAAPKEGQGVTTLELFFDLVFVYTITQVTSVVRSAHSTDAYLHALVILMVTWWMYDGYCWLANNVGPTTLSTRVPMLVAMGAFLVMAAATPEAFGAAAWPFAAAYLVVVVVHAAQYTRSSFGGSATAIFRVAPLNLAISAGLLIAAPLSGDLHWIGWGVAVLALLIAVLRVRGIGFDIRPEHFAERHQLLIIIALGEIVVATGGGAQEHLTELRVLAAVLAAMVLLAGLWWVYFGGDDVRAAAALSTVPEERTTETAFWAYSMGHLLHIVGLVLVAAGLHDVIASPSHALPQSLRVCLAVGVAVFLIAEVLLRRVLRFGSGRALAPGAAVAVAASLLGVLALVELAVLAVVVVAVLVADERLMA